MSSSHMHLTTICCSESSCGIHHTNLRPTNKNALKYIIIQGDLIALDFALWPLQTVVRICAVVMEDVSSRTTSGSVSVVGAGKPLIVIWRWKLTVKATEMKMKVNCSLLLQMSVKNIFLFFFFDHPQSEGWLHCGLSISIVARPVILIRQNEIFVNYILSNKIIHHLKQIKLTCFHIQQLTLSYHI